jgi:hypothetical protein
MTLGEARGWIQRGGKNAHGTITNFCVPDGITFIESSGSEDPNLSE